MSNYSSKIATTSRLFLGLVFFVFGLNGFFGFLPQPPLPAAAQGFIGGLASAGYFFPLLKGTEVLAGALLLGNRYVPLALTVLAPITINILAFHTILAPSLGLPLVLVSAQLYLAWSYRDSFRGVLAASAKPTASGVSHQAPVVATA